MNKAEVITKIASRKLGIVMLAAWLLNEQLIGSMEFTVISTVYILGEALIDAVTRRRTEPPNGE